MTEHDCIVSLGGSSEAPTEFVCFHHAGGASRFFYDWADQFDLPVRLVGVELPGRGRRFGEDPPASVDAVVQEAADALEERGDADSRVLFGHSLGGMLAFAVGRRLLDRGATVDHVFVSSARTVHPEGAGERHKLSDDALREELRSMQGTPEKVLQNEELMNLMLPVLRADLEIVETLDLRDADPLDVPLDILGGADDTTVDPRELEVWNDYTQSTSTTRIFPGGHFYLQNRTGACIRWIEQRLLAEGTVSKTRRPLDMR